MEKDIRLLHIYSQYCWHADSYIVGNRRALEQLRDIINQALEKGFSFTPNSDCPFVVDGEGYQVVVIRNDAPWGDPKWELTWPYAADYACSDQENRLDPDQLLTDDQLKEISSG